MGSGCHVDEIVLLVRAERIRAREVVKSAVDLLEIPRVVQSQRVETDLGLGRDRAEIGDDLVGEAAELCLRQELESPDEQVFLAAERDAWSPLAPAVRTATVEGAAEDADRDVLRHR